MKLNTLLILILLVVVSCGKKTETKNTDKVTQESTEQVAENIEKISMDIGGMTCEVGCAKLIESKLAKTKGVKDVKVVFTDSTSTVSYDKNKITQEEIVNTVEKIADGGLYKVKKVIVSE